MAKDIRTGMIQDAEARGTRARLAIRVVRSIPTSQLLDVASAVRMARIDPHGLTDSEHVLLVTHGLFMGESLTAAGEQVASLDACRASA